MTLIQFVFFILVGCNSDTLFIPFDTDEIPVVVVDSFVQNENIDRLDVLAIIDTSCSMQDGDLDRISDSMINLRDDISTLTENYKFGFLNANLMAYSFAGPLDSNSMDIDFIMSISMLAETNTETMFVPLYSYSTNNPSAFFRDDADLLIFMFTDEREQSSLTPTDMYTWINEKWPDKIVDVVMITPVGDPDSFSNDCGEIDDEYITFGLMFGHYPIDLCDDNWHTWLSHSSFLTTFLDSIMLTQKPIVESIVVYINMIKIDEWTYDEETNVVYLNIVPAPGALVEVGYNVQLE